MIEKRLRNLMVLKNFIITISDNTIINIIWQSGSYRGIKYYQIKLQVYIYAENMQENISIIVYQEKNINNLVPLQYLSLRSSNK